MPTSLMLDRHLREDRGKLFLTIVWLLCLATNLRSEGLAASHRRLGLLVGNQTISGKPDLLTPAKNIAGLGQELDSMHFEVKTEQSLGKLAIEDAVQNFASTLQPGDV